MADNLEDNELDTTNVEEDNTEEDNTEEDSNVLDMSDEDFLNLSNNSTANSNTATTEAEVEKQEESDEVSDTPTDSEEINKTVAEPQDEEKNTALSDTASAQLTLDDTNQAKPEDSADKQTNTTVIDYKVEYEKLMAPFKANGVQMQVKNTDDVLTLMQMGANYHKKMAGLKPALKIMKLLEQNDLMDSSKISYLIDLHKKNPDAITKLIKDSGLDPLSVDIDSESKYKPPNRTVSDTELELDAVLEEIKDTPTYAKTLNVITEKWDGKSRNTIANNPHIISVINGHVANGIYDKVMSAVEYERSFGRLIGISDFDAYKMVGDALQSQGQLNIEQPVATTKQLQTPAKVANKITEEQRSAAKKAVSPTQSVKTSGTLADFNPLAMSDEEFMKLEKSKFIKR